MACVYEGCINKQEIGVIYVGMGQAVSYLLGWLWRKPSTAPPHHHGDAEEYAATYDVDVDSYAPDPELGVEHPAPWRDKDEERSFTGSRRWMGPYNNSHKILLVGEGDFSFSASLAVAFGDASNITATSLDSLQFLGRNYSKAVRNVVELTRRRCKVMHGIDATRMAKHPSLKHIKFDRIIFNFPHAGFFDYYEPRDMQISRHQALVKGFLGNAKKMITEDGEIHITQKTTSFFREWNIKLLASSEGLRLAGKAPFNFQAFRGYRTKFGYGGDDNFGCNPCKTYIFQLASK